MPKYGFDNRDPLLLDADLIHMTRSGWLPKTDLPGLEQMRERHEGLIAQRSVQHAAVSALEKRFEDEDKASQDELNLSYVESRPPAPTDCTPSEERKPLLAEAKAHATAAARAVVTHAYEVRERLRGCEDLPEGWNPWIQVQAQRVPPDGEAAKALARIAVVESELRQEIVDAQRAIDEAHRRIREYVPIRQWLASNGNASTGQIMTSHVLTVPPTHTGGTKPRDLNVPGWWGDEVRDVLVVAEGQEHLIPEGAQTAVIEMTDPEVLAMERGQHE